MANTPDPTLISNLSAEADILQDKLNSLVSALGSQLDKQIKNKLQDLTTSTNEFIGEFAKGQNIVSKLNEKLKTIQKDANKLSLDRLTLEKDLAKAQQVNNNRLANRLQDQLFSNRLASQQLESTQTLVYKLFQAAEAEKKIADEKKKQNSLTGVLKKNLAEAFKPFTEMLTLAGIFKVIIDGALRFNKTSVEIGKNIGYSASESNRVATNLKNTAQYSGDINMTLANVAGAMTELNTTTGYVAEYSADTLRTQVMLTKQFGLTGDEAAGIYKFSVLTGQSSSKINDEMVGAFVASRNSLRVGANFKQVMAEVAKVSGQLAANFANNPALITKAIVQAKALGTTLEDTKAQGESLLNFESSIESELKAELLTGQQMNLERARAAALQGDQVTVMKELTNQGMTLEKFQSMNVIAQKSFAEAIGLSSDKLADQLTKQKLAIESGKSLSELTKEEALEAEKRQGIQDKFNAAILKLQDLFGNILAGPIGGLLDALTNMLPIITSIATVWGVVYALNQGMVLFEKAKLGIQIAQRGAALGYNGVLLARQAILGGELAKSVGIAAAWTIANFPMSLLGIAAAAGVGALIYNLAKPAGDMFSPADGKTQVSTKEGGLFELSPNDDLVAYPGAAKASKNSGQINTSIDLSPMISAINQVKSAVDRLYNKDTTINMDGKKVGTTLTQGSYKVA